MSDYRWAPPIPVCTKLVIAEGSGTLGHHYLLKMFHGFPHKHYIELNLNHFGTPCRDYPGLFSALIGRDCSLLFLTLDSHLYWTNQEYFYRAIHSSPARVSGILHRIPMSPSEDQALSQAGPHLDKIIVLAEEIKQICEDKYKLNNVYYVPHIAQNFYLKIKQSRLELRRKFGIKANAIVLSMLGEQREGKGLSLLLDSLIHIPLAIRSRLFFVIAGKATDKILMDARAALKKSGVSFILGLKSNDDRHNYAVVDAKTYAEMLAISDYGLLLYQSSQRTVMSGGFSDYLKFGSAIIATEDSLVGRLVNRLNVGHVLNDETPESLARLLTIVVEEFEKPKMRSKTLREHMTSLDDRNIEMRIREILRD